MNVVTVDSSGPGLSNCFHNGQFQLSCQAFSSNSREIMCDLLLGKLTLSLLVSISRAIIKNSNLFLFTEEVDLLILTRHPLSGVPAQVAFLWSPEFSYLAAAAHSGMCFYDFLW